MEEEAIVHNEEKKGNIFSTRQGKMLAAAVGIASLLAACNFDQSSDHPTTTTMPSGAEQNLQEINTKLVDEWQKEAKKHLQDPFHVGPNEEFIENIGVIAGLSQGELLDYMKNEGVMLKPYPGQFPDLTPPQNIYKIGERANILKGIISEGNNMISRYDGSKMDLKYIYFLCRDVDGTVLDLNNQPLTEEMKDSVCVIPITNTTLAHTP